MCSPLAGLAFPPRPRALLRRRGGGCLLVALWAALAVPWVVNAAVLRQGPYRIRDHGHNAVYEVALDEVTFAGAPRPEKIDPAADLGTLLRRVESFQRGPGAIPRLVLYPAGEERTEVNRRVLTEEILVRVSEEGDPDELRRAAGADRVTRVKLLPGFCRLHVTGIAAALVAAERLRALPTVLSAEPQLARAAEKKLLPNDTLFAHQWHLLNAGQNGGVAGVDLHLTNVWAASYRGAGVVIGIVDDGLAYTHPDLAPNYNPALSYDFNEHDPDPLPNPSVDFHGTAVAGLSAARGNNGLGVCGVAFEATLAGLRLLGAPASDGDEADAMLHSNAVIHIKNNSWGAADCPRFGTVLEGPGPLLGAALAEGVSSGRQGRGTIYVWAGGNGGVCGEDVNYDGFANSIEVCAIGAVTDQGQHPSYSESGACLVACAPSGTPGRQGLTTTDLQGNNGFNRPGSNSDLNDRDYTQTFAGTSGASPLAAGVVALILQASPNLGWRDVKEILLRSSARLQPLDPVWRTNAAGIAHHPQFGGGLIDAEQAMHLATNWPGLGPSRVLSIPAEELPQTIPDNDAKGLLLTFTVTNVGFRVEHATVTLSTTHPNWGDLAVTLTSPAAMSSALAEVHMGNPTYDYDAWTFSSVRHWGEQAAGNWTVRVADLAALDVGTLDALELRLYGSIPETTLAIASSGATTALQLRSSAVGWAYAIEASEDLHDWTPLSNVTIPVNGRVAFTNNGAAASGRQFYRARLLP